MSREYCDASSISGLFHDLGELILNSYFPHSHDVALQEAQKRNIPLHIAETEVLDVNHQELGAYLLGLWGMPMSVVNAVAKHHDPLPDDLTDDRKVMMITAIASAAIDSGAIPPTIPDSLVEIIDIKKQGLSKDWLATITTIMESVGDESLE